MAMAKNLMKAGNDLTVIAHRNRAPVDDLVGLGALESQNWPDYRHRATLSFSA